jgi:hypothetical protein
VNNKLQLQEYFVENEELIVNLMHNWVAENDVMFVATLESNFSSVLQDQDILCVPTQRSGLNLPLLFPLL